MKALTIQKYGSPDFLNIQDVDKPVPAKGEVLIKVKAVSLNDWDLGLITGTPVLPNRLMAGLFKPSIIVGSDIAGTIEAVGRDVTVFQPGDQVYGDLSGCGFGGFADYVCAPENALVLKPPSMTDEQAAAIPQAGMLAYQGVMAGEPITSGQTVLINGAGGGVGSIAIQLLKQYEVEVTGVDSADKLQAMRSWGFDQVLDYREQNFTRNGKCYDLILDAKTNRSPKDYKRVLNPQGVYATVGGTSIALLKIALAGLGIGRSSGKKLCVIPLKQNRDLAHFNELFEAGTFKPVLDGVYNFNQSDIRKAFRHLQAATHKGKLVVRMSQF